eukprot:TRINITY_DN27892_c0_g1_i5.p1 TRINITY_DN27892_c0_g1~~TRINITY_DN27892_c0_g1_i5.p1  ORF type:complete len:379 (+),score=62.00 TRINITY_DN27892_c0_g1_i5:75-1211(+)
MAAEAALFDEAAALPLPGQAAPAAPAAGEAASGAAVQDPFQAFVSRDGVCILDGGFSTELQEASGGAPLDPVLWGSGALRSAPDAVRDVHLRYMRAGADAVLTAGYQSSRLGWQRAQPPATAEEADAYTAAAVDLASQARDSFLASPESTKRIRPLVVASVGPYAACLADGSEYNPKYGTEPGAVVPLVDFHLPRVAAALRGAPDALAFETLPCAADAAAVLRIVQEEHIGGRAVPAAWISFCCRSAAELTSGESLEACAEAVLQHDRRRRVLGLGVNCLAPQHAEGAVRAVAAVIARHAAAQGTGGVRRYVVCYANSGEEWDGAEKEWRKGTGIRGQDAEFAALAGRLRAAGAELIGGCCRTSPATIAAVRAALSPG